MNINCNKEKEINLNINGSVIKLDFSENETSVNEDICDILTSSYNERNLN